MGMAGVLVGCEVVSKIGSVEVVAVDVSVVAGAAVGVVPSVVPFVVAAVRADAMRVMEDRPGMLKATDS